MTRSIFGLAILGLAACGSSGTSGGTTGGALVICHSVGGGSGSGPSACSDTWSNCADNHEYAVNCTASDTCACVVDGQTVKSFSGTKFCSGDAGVTGSNQTPFVNQQCGWNLAGQ
jgi:hypothetical protein